MGGERKERGGRNRKKGGIREIEMKETLHFTSSVHSISVFSLRQGRLIPEMLPISPLPHLNYAISSRSGLHCCPESYD